MRQIYILVLVVALGAVAWFFIDADTTDGDPGPAEAGEGDASPDVDNRLSEPAEGPIEDLTD
ncbi:hypothetical protein [Histidinibacterium aquaticum]|uniref:Uncharacterized protein n=1 Tax=Histidinibacterium aquaticum TaxID=2613962 RepID=A0A5J5GPG3_9RHOB|nr:hypothetical protein [Histidinibacterium aquaticum]KAA9009332.1 hypothetical protein F3S47_08790 [Histidinibacterium aquaticum]